LRDRETERLGDGETGRLRDREARRLGNVETGRLRDREARRLGNVETGRLLEGRKFKVYYFYYRSICRVPLRRDLLLLARGFSVTLQ